MSDNNLAIRNTAGEVTVFDPAEVNTRQAKLDAVIEYAKRVADWPTLEAAVDHKLEEIREFVGWWDDAVTPNRGARTDINSGRNLCCADAEHLTNISQVQVSRWRKRMRDEDAFRKKLYGKAYAEVFGKAENYKANGDEDDEWYTPLEYIEAAREVMGGIDLDPASNPQANDTVKAEQYFTAKENGLAQEWHGRVWLNPPYSRDLMPAFVHKLITEYQSGRVIQAIMVSHNNTDTAWFHAITRACRGVCFPSGRIRFYRGNDVAAPVNGQAFFYLGEVIDPFHAVFSRYGIILAPVAP